MKLLLSFDGLLRFLCVQIFTLVHKSPLDKIVFPVHAPIILCKNSSYYIISDDVFTRPQGPKSNILVSPLFFPKVNTHTKVDGS